MNERTHHCIALIIFVILSIITTRVLLFGESAFIYRDTQIQDPDAFFSNALSAFDLEAMRRLLHLGPFLTITSALGLSQLSVQKASFLTVHFLIGFLAYWAGYNFLLSKIREQRKNLLFALSIIFGFFYLYNPRVGQGLSLTSFGFAFSYALIPLIFYFFNKSLNEKSFSNIFITSMLISLSIAGTMQFLAWLPAFILIPWLILVIIRKWRLHEPLFITMRNAALIVVLTTLISFYWVFVALSSVTSSGSIIQPGYVLTNQMLESFSTTTSLTNVIRLMSSWWPPIELTPIFHPYIWTPLTFVMPIIFTLSLIIVQDRKLKFYLCSFAGIALFVMFFVKGTQPPLGEFYPSLYDIPIIGWMFRVPSTTAMFLPFYMGLVIIFGLYTILIRSTRVKIIRYTRFVIPIALIVSIPLVSWPMFTGDFGGAYRNSDKFIPKPFIEKDYNIDIAKKSAIVFGDEGKFDQINSLFDINSSLIRTDFNLGSLQEHAVSDMIILDNTQDLRFFFIDESAILIKPFDHTRNHLPSRVWSVAGTGDPLHGPFHEYLNQYGITNADTDYGNGLVITWGRDQLDMPIYVQDSTDYVIFMRYMQNAAGGSIKISIDENYEKELFTNGQSNRFLWEMIDTTYLSEGAHRVEIENIDGFNAINMIVLVPAGKIIELESDLQNYIKGSKLVHVLDKSSFSQQGRLLKEEYLITGFREGTSAIQELSTPEQTTHIVLQFGAIGDANSVSSYTIRNLSITPTEDRLLFETDFELTEADMDKWKLASNGFLSRSDDTGEPISGEHSLRIHISNGTSSLWQVVYTDKIPVRANLDLDVQFTITSDSSSPHAKMVFYDQENKVISADTIFRSPSRNYLESFQKIVRSPPNAEYFSLQFWAMPDPDNDRMFILDNIKIEQLLPESVSPSNFRLFKNLETGNQEMMVNRDSIKVDIDQSNSTEWNIIQTRPIPMIENLGLRYDVTLQEENLQASYLKVLYYSNVERELEDDMEGTQYDLHALHFFPQQSEYADVEILKPSNYTIALNAMACPQCESITISIGATEKEFSLFSNKTEFQWIYFTTYLTEGRSLLNIYSNGNTYVDTILIYSDSYEAETIEDLFAISEKPAEIVNLERISSGKYVIQVNASRPFILVFDREYDGFWSATANGKEYVSLMLYPSINGFYINDTGLLNITIEYKRQEWFLLGSMVSIISISGAIFYLAWQKRERIATRISNRQFMKRLLYPRDESR